MRSSRPLAWPRAWLVALALAAGASPLAAAETETEPPARVVSMNLCTDQLAMLLAAPGQLVSVSHIARDPLSSAMATEAEGWPVNHGQAEEIFLLRPDLVLAGTYTTRATVELLRRLGIDVVEFAPDSSLQDVRAAMLRMGEVLGRQEEAAAMLAGFDADISALAGSPAPDAPHAALYYANGYTSGEHSLAGEVMTLAGFRNIAAEGPLAGRWVIALEELILARPDLVITGTPYPGASNAEELLRHPALAEIMAGMPGAGLADSDWVCGTPHVARALANMTAARQAAEAMLEARP